MPPRSYSVEFTRSAQKEFLSLSSELQDRVVEALELIARNPATKLLNIRKLKGAPDVWRCRIGDYRIIYEMRQSRLVVVVIKIGHRSDVYRRF